MINKDKITDHYNELHDQYKKLDLLIKGNSKLLALLDNEHNLYAYSDRSRLFESLEMMIKGNSAYSEIDLINRVIHFIATQYDVLVSTNNDEIRDVVICISETFIEVVQTLISSISVKDLPEYISKWITKYVSLSQAKEELRRKKIMDDIEVIL